MMRDIKFYFSPILFLLITFSCKSQRENELPIKDIVIVNTGILSRIDLAREVEIVNSFHPKVVGIDAVFVGQKGPNADSALARTLNKCENLVLAARIQNYDSLPNENYQDIQFSHPAFLKKCKIGFVNAILENDEKRTLKRFIAFEKVRGMRAYHFSLQLAFAYDSVKAKEFVDSHPKINDVQYIGNEDAFTTFSDFDVFKGNLKEEDIKGKIVIFGYMGPYKGYDGPYIDDKFYSPLYDKNISDKPDMWGVVYLANILAQILND
jgi:CHASE2 domain-containing sensor protein